MAGIYIHIPFCKQACYYCDFHFSTNLGVKDDLFAALLEEISLQTNYLSEKVTSIYFGGGTPSLAEVSELSSVLDKISSTFAVSEDAEITLEGNPDDLTASKLRDLREIGINRLSIGIQSFDDDVLRSLNRVHDSRSAVECVGDARKAGFDNISIDLIYAIPGQNKFQWEENIRRGLALSPEHISCYSLTIEEKTVFGNWAAKGKLVAVSEDASAEQFETLLFKLETAGYEHYEISNFAKPGFYSRHNSSYWKQQHYLGIGPSAHSYNGTSRQYNVRNNFQYIEGIREGRVPATIESLTIEDQINDYLLTTLRTSWGTDLRKLRSELHYDLLKTQETYLKTLLQNDLAVLAGDHLILTRKGKFVADKISSDLFIAAGS